LVKRVLFPVCFMALFIAIEILLHPGMQLGEAKNDAPMLLDQETNVEQIGPEWFDTDWNYRVPIIITNNSGDIRTDYQIVIRLDEDNFDFDKANSDGSDVRFTANDGETELNYWIESWNDALAYIWVKVPHLDLGNNVIYIYFDNSDATSTSNGTDTFIFFDNDWSQFVSGGGCAAEFPWDCINPGFQVSLGIIELGANEGVISHDTYINKAMGYRANYGSGAGVLSGGFGIGTGGPRVIIRDLSTDPDDLYLQNFVSTTPRDYLINRVNGINWHDQFHVYEVRWWVDLLNSTNKKSIACIDHGIPVSSTYPQEVPNNNLSIAFNSPELSGATLFVDWVYVRNYTNPEPEVSFGTQQGLVDLKISMADAPDPIYAGETLTYQLTITNTSLIVAPGVVVTDTLPAGVSFVSTTPSQGTCDDHVICDLGSIEGGANATISILVNTTLDGVITNTAEVGSLAYDSYIETNIGQATTEVSPSADLSITMQADPEIVKPGALITYDLWIINLGPSVGTNTSVGLTLPEEVDFYSAIPDFCNESNGIVTCSLGDINSGVESQILITGFVQGTASGNLQAVAHVSSIITHDPNLTNNIGTEETTVDDQQPEVSWINPVGNEQVYNTNRNTITLTAYAEDNYGVGKVVFTMWDHLWSDGQGHYGHYVPIGTVFTEPYEVIADISQLKSGELYQFYVEAYDLAGNKSLRQRIIIIKENLTFLPLIAGK
jgi:uncharacterized repeat protein (TIGR01451 family)